MSKGPSLPVRFGTVAELYLGRARVVRHVNRARAREGGGWTETDARRPWTEWRAVGGSLEAFARRSGFSGQRLQWWVKRLGLRDQGTPRGSFVPVVVREAVAKARAPVVLVVDDLARLEVRELTTETAGWVGVLTALRERRS